MNKLLSEAVENARKRWPIDAVRERWLADLKISNSVIPEPASHDEVAYWHEHLTVSHYKTSRDWLFWAIEFVDHMIWPV